MTGQIQIHLRCNDDYEPRFVVEIQGPVYKSWTQLEEIRDYLDQYLQHKEDYFAQVALFRQQKEGGDA